MSQRDSSRDVSTARRASQSAYRTALDIVLTGVVTLLPIVVTVYVLNAALGIIVSLLDPFVKLLRYFGLLETVQSNVVVTFLVRVGIYRNAVDFVGELSAMLVLAVVVVVVGAVARYEYGQQLVDVFDTIVTAIPGVAPLYRGVRRMGDAMLESEVENFRSVKLVEFPRDGSFVVGFETARPPASIRQSANHAEMRTLFLPLAPNPVMGGFLAHIPEERILEVDMTVEEGIQCVVTSGIAVGEEVELSEEQLRDVGVADADRAADGDDSRT